MKTRPAQRTIPEILTDLHRKISQEKRGHKYSLRLFAKDLGISSGRLNALLRGTNLPSARTLKLITTRLKLPATSIREFQAAIEQEKKRRLLNKADIILKQEDYSIIVDWVPYAIMCLIQTQNFIMTSENVAISLGISKRRADQNIKKLIDLNLIEYVNKKWQPSNLKMTTETDIPSTLIRQSHEEKMNLALQRMGEVDVVARDFSSIVFPMDPELIGVAKRMLMDFRRSLAEAMSGKCITEVYALNIQLFPLTKNYSEGPVSAEETK